MNNNKAEFIYLEKEYIQSEYKKKVKRKKKRMNFQEIA
jgi:hypothetical protein